MSDITEIAPDVFRISTYVDRAGITFNQFLVRDDEPLLYHAGQNALFDDIRTAVASLIDVATLRWIGFSHFEGDECGALNRWLAIAPKATPLAGAVAAATCINDFSTRAPRVLDDNATFATGRHTFQFLATPYIPHNWESSLLFEQTTQTLFCSDLLLQRGPQPASVTDAAALAAHAIADFEAGQSGPFHDAIPWTSHTPAAFERLAKLQPRVLAIMHGASLAGDGAATLRAYAQGLGALLNQPKHAAATH